MICKVCNNEVNEFHLNDVFGIKKHSICYKCFCNFPLINKISYIDNYECLSIYEYKDQIQDLIFSFKGLKDYELKNVFLEFMIDYLNDKYRGYVITYAPSFKDDDFKRGFNHVEAMCSLFTNEKRKLFYKKENYKQSDQSYNDRKNVSKIIGLNLSEIDDLKKVLIVDDVLTSGNTLKTCASLLYKEGIRKIKLLTISKVVEN